jgi:hypothetical protein
MIIAHLSRYFYRQKARFFLTPMSYQHCSSFPEQFAGDPAIQDKRSDEIALNRAPV